MGRVRIYCATSIDGFIADNDGDVDWLEPYEPTTYGFGEFAKDVGAVVMGRRTFEIARVFGEWPYQSQRAYILTSKTPWNLPDNAEFCRDGIEAAVAAALTVTRKDVWIVGGSVTMQTAIDAGLVDLIEVFIVPVLLGSGLPLLQALENRPTLAFEGIETFSNGVVKLTYRPIKTAVQSEPSETEGSV